MRKYVRRRASRRATGVRRRAATRYKRTSYRARRTTARPRIRTRKSILNVTSRKKKNAMLAYSNSTATGAAAAITPNSLTIDATTNATILWCATAQDLTSNNGGPLGAVSQQATRTSTTCYMRGLKENLRVTTSSGLPWFHRRICFTYKGDIPFQEYASGDTPTLNQTPYVDTSNGISRLLLNMNKNAAANTRNEWESVVFRGANGVDWNDQLIAPIDTTRITLKSDKTYRYFSGNQSGVFKEIHAWYPMNSNIVYDDDESGSTEVTSYYSVDSKAGMGDYYILDYIRSGIGGATSDLLNLNVNSILYWHEK
uniref:Capsid protein n=1 Tax=Genomoviridae sp. TaxID=2202565 RepID=A0A858NE47_9VIRU|nr:MAG: capsid protein [Genomoviridae sp.]